MNLLGSKAIGRLAAVISAALAGAAHAAIQADSGGSGGSGSIRVPHIKFELVPDRPTDWTVNQLELSWLTQVHPEFARYRERGGSIPAPAEWVAEARALLPAFQAAWDARGHDLLRRVVEATGIPAPIESKVLGLYLSPGLGDAYDMKSYPFYPYLASAYPEEYRWSTFDFVDWYMFHEVLHWYLLYQPWLGPWTPTLDRLFARHKGMAGIMDGPAIYPGDWRYPPLPMNMFNFLGHVHLNVLRRLAFDPEPATWKRVKTREKATTGDPFYALAIDEVDRMSDAELGAAVQEIRDSAGRWSALRVLWPFDWP